MGGIVATVVQFKKHETEKHLEQIVMLDELTDGELVRLMLDLMSEVKLRAHRLRSHSQRDEQGRIWAMPAIMRALQYKINHIFTVVGKGMVQ